MTSGTDPGQYLYSVVVPVYNSERIVGRTIAAIVDFFEHEGWRFELVLVNDGSIDESWKVISQAAEADDRLIAINLLKNYGQHNANLCGFRHTTGDFLITMDDDLQNPPSEIIHLVNKAMEGHDVVFGRFDRKKARWHRSLGTKAIAMVNRRVFAQPAELVVSNFRILNREVVDRICTSSSAFPYITGQALRYSNDRANADVRHDARPEGKSNYNLARIAGLVLRILFSYSSAPLRIVGAVGAAIAVVSIAIGTTFAIRGITTGRGVSGWTSTITMLSFLNGTIILMMAMLGEYLIRTLNQLSDNQPYYIAQAVNTDRVIDES